MDIFLNKFSCNLALALSRLPLWLNSLSRLPHRLSATDTADPDVSYADGTQVQADAGIVIGIKTDKVVQLHSGTASADHAAAIAATTIENLDFMVIAYNDFGGTVGTPTPGDLTAVTPANGQNFTWS